MSQSLSQIWIHLIFSTRDRKPVFTNTEHRTRLYEYLAKSCFNQGCQTKIVGGYIDHVHLLILLGKTKSLSTFVRELKSTSSKWIKQIEPKNILYNKFEWQSGYSAFSVSHSILDKVYNYILTQDDHHQRQNYRTELVQILKRNQIDFDEKYLWN